MAKELRLPRVAVDVPSLEVGVRKIKIATNTQATTIIRQQTVDTQINVEHLLLLVSRGFSAIKSKVFLVRNHSFLTR